MFSLVGLWPLELPAATTGQLPPVKPTETARKSPHAFGDDKTQGVVYTFFERLRQNKTHNNLDIVFKDDSRRLFPK